MNTYSLDFVVDASLLPCVLVHALPPYVYSEPHPC